MKNILLLLLLITLLKDEHMEQRSFDGKNVNLLFFDGVVRDFKLFSRVDKDFLKGRNNYNQLGMGGLACQVFELSKKKSIIKVKNKIYLEFDNDTTKNLVITDTYINDIENDPNFTVLSQNIFTINKFISNQKLLYLKAYSNDQISSYQTEEKGYVFFLIIYPKNEKAIIVNSKKRLEEVFYPLSNNNSEYIDIYHNKSRKMYIDEHQAFDKNIGDKNLEKITKDLISERLDIGVDILDKNINSLNDIDKVLAKRIINDSFVKDIYHVVEYYTSLVIAEQINSENLTAKVVFDFDKQESIIYVDSKTNKESFSIRASLVDEYFNSLYSKRTSLNIIANNKISLYKYLLHRNNEAEDLPW